MVKRILKITGVLALAATLLLVLLIAGLAIRRNVPASLPPPTGKYPVGRTITTWRDPSRLETFDGSGGPREIAVWIWYPAAPIESPPAPYMPAEWAQAREADRGVGSLFFQSVASIQSHAVENAPVAADGPYPVLIFEPGLGPLVSEYATLVEDLASRGYVVIGLNPTFSASITVIDGRVIPRSDQGTIRDDATPEQAQEEGDNLVAVWAADDRFAIDQAAQINADSSSPFLGKLDVQRIGLLGHSFGGAAALEACHIEIGCLAAADVDGTPFGTVISEGLDRPALFIWSEVEDRSDPMIVKSDRDVGLIWDALPEGYQVTINGTRHFNFTDLAVGFNPLAPMLDIVGEIDAARGLRITADYLAAFFGKTLRGQDSPMLHGLSSVYPEVELAVR